MRSIRVGWMLLGALAVLAPAQARAQTTDDMYREDRGFIGPLVWNIGGSLAVPVGSSSNRSNLGGGFTLGLTYNLQRIFGFQFEYGAFWSSLKANNGSALASSAGIFGNGFLDYFNLNVVVRPGHSGRGGFYLIGGGGLYYRSVSVNQVQGTTVAPYCDPYLYFCSAVPVTASSVIGSRSSWNWGLDAGLGFTFGVAQPVRLYLEARYHYIWGPTFTGVNNSQQTATGQYIPITLGVQF